MIIMNTVISFIGITVFFLFNEYNSYVLLLLLNQKLSKFLAVLAFLREKLTTQDCQGHQPEMKKSK